MMKNGSISTASFGSTVKLLLFTIIEIDCIIVTVIFLTELVLKWLLKKWNINSGSNLRGVVWEIVRYYFLHLIVYTIFVFLAEKGNWIAGTISAVIFSLLSVIASKKSIYKIYIFGTRKKKIVYASLIITLTVLALLIVRILNKPGLYIFQ